jgi:glucose/arabinose dehydrogenase
MAKDAARTNPFIAAFAGAVFAAGALLTPAAAQEAVHAAPFDVETLAEGLNHPWNVAFLPDGAMLVTELPGRLRLVRRGEVMPEPVAGVPEVYYAGQGGLFDVLLDPDFAQNRVIYLSFAHGTPEANNTRVVRATFDGKALSNVETIFDASPQKDTPVHYGGRMTLKGDGTLLVTVGDGFDYREDAQRLSNHLGTVVRINRDGTVPEDNPFVNDNDALPEIYTYGHRNEQAILYDAASDRIYEQEHGPRGGDEVNVLEPGKNYGWPVITGGVDYSGAQISPYTEYPGMEQPWVEWTPSIAPAGMALYRGAMFKDWEGDLLVTSLVEMSLRRIDIEDGAPKAQEVYLVPQQTRLRDVAVAPDGAILVLTDEEDGKILRLTPAKASGS